MFEKVVGCPAIGALSSSSFATSCLPAPAANFSHSIHHLSLIRSYIYTRAWSMHTRIYHGQSIKCRMNMVLSRLYANMWAHVCTGSKKEYSVVHGREEMGQNCSMLGLSSALIRCQFQLSLFCTSPLWNRTIISVISVLYISFVEQN